MQQHASREVMATEVYDYLDSVRQDLAQLEAVTASASGLLEHIPFAVHESRDPTKASRLLCLVALIHQMTHTLLTRIDADLKKLDDYGLPALNPTAQRKGQNCSQNLSSSPKEHDPAPEKVTVA